MVKETSLFVPPSETSRSPIDLVPVPGLVVLNRDLFFGVKIGNTLRGLGYLVEFATTSNEFARKLSDVAASPALGIVDINAGVDWSVISRLMGTAQCAVPVLAFGSHTDVDGMRAAKAAGVTRVVSNGDFHRDMVKLVQRYALFSPNLESG